MSADTDRAALSAPAPLARISAALVELLSDQGSIQVVASAEGEAAMAVRMIQQHLRSL